MHATESHLGILQIILSDEDDEDDFEDISWCFSNFNSYQGLIAEPFEKNPRESFYEMVEAGHERIDEIFGTEQADMYAADGKTARGELPPTGEIIKTSNIFLEMSLGI